MLEITNINRSIAGFSYHLTEELVAEHRKKNFIEILDWLHDANKFLSIFRTPIEKELARKLRAGEI